MVVLGAFADGFDASRMAAENVPYCCSQEKGKVVTELLPEECANCGRTIGKLETPMVWRGNVVCTSCRKILKTADASDAESIRSDAGREVPLTREEIEAEELSRVAAAQGREQNYPKAFDARVCPNPKCTYEGEGQIRKRGSWITLIFLLLIGVLPGILYAIFFGGHNTYCPRCGIEWGRTQWMKLDSSIMRPSTRAGSSRA